MFSVLALLADVKGYSKTILYSGENPDLGLFACLFAIFRPTREFFTHIETPYCFIKFPL